MNTRKTVSIETGKDHECCGGRNREQGRCRNGDGHHHEGHHHENGHTCCGGRNRREGRCRRGQDS